MSRSLFFKQLTIQLLSGAEERAITLSDKEASFSISETDGTLLFVGETFCRICRRGSSGNFNISCTVIPKLYFFMKQEKDFAHTSYHVYLCPDNTGWSYWLQLRKASSFLMNFP